MIEISNLTKKFGDFTAVDGLTLNVGRGEIFGLLGPNGAGKTTTVKILTGLLLPTSGTIRIAGEDMIGDPQRTKRRIGLVPDEPFVYPKLTGVEFLRFVGDIYEVSLDTQKKRIPELLEMFELKPYGGELTESYSHGMRQKLVLASALLHEPDVLLCDEPMVGLDPKSVKVLKEIFQRLSRRGCTIFMCTHILEIAERLCHRIGIMLSGKMKAVGTLQELHAGLASARGKRAGASTEENDFVLEDVFLSLTGGHEYASLLQYL